MQVQFLLLLPPLFTSSSKPHFNLKIKSLPSFYFLVPLVLPLFLDFSISMDLIYYPFLNRHRKFFFFPNQIKCQYYQTHFLLRTFISSSPFNCGILRGLEGIYNSQLFIVRTFLSCCCCTFNVLLKVTISF